VRSQRQLQAIKKKKKKKKPKRKKQIKQEGKTNKHVSSFLFFFFVWDFGIIDRD